MRRLRKLRLSQKVALLIGLGVAALLVGLYVATAGFSSAGGGWFGYPPTTNATDTYFIVRHVKAWQVIGVPVALIGAWTALAMWLLGVTVRDG